MEDLLQQPRIKIQFVSQISVPFANFPRRIAGGNGIRLHIFGDNGTRANHRAIANGYSRQNHGAVGNPGMIADDDISATIGKVRRLRVMTQRENGSLRANGDIVPGSNMKLSAIKQAAKIDDIPLSQVNLSSIEKTATGLHGCT